MANLIELSGKFYSEGEQVPFEVTIHLPEQEGSSGDYVCRVLSQQLFSRCMNARGVSRHQSISSAVALVRDALLGRIISEEDMAFDFEREDALTSIHPFFHPQDGSNRVPTGRYLVLHEDGVRFLGVSYENGVLHGPYVSYWPDGKVSSEGQHKYGKANGIWHYYNRNGTIHAIIRFEDDSEICSALYVYDAHGALCDIIQKDESGKRKGST